MTGRAFAVGLAALLALSACGQKGPLYLPESSGEVITRPTMTPPAEGAGSTAAPDGGPAVPAPAAPADERVAAPPAAPSATPRNPTTPRPRTKPSP